MNGSLLDALLAADKALRAALRCEIEPLDVIPFLGMLTSQTERFAIHCQDADLHEFTLEVHAIESDIRKAVWEQRFVQRRLREGIKVLAKHVVPARKAMECVV